MSNTKKEGKDWMDAIMDISAVLSMFVLAVCGTGLKRVNFKSADFWWGTLTFLLSLAVLVLLPINNLQWGFEYLLGIPLPWGFEFFFDFPGWFQFLSLLVLIIGSISFSMGLLKFLQLTKYQNMMKMVGLKAYNKETPKVVAVEPNGAYRKKVIVDALGIGLEEFENKKGSMRASFKQIVEGVEVASDKGKVVIYLCERELPKMIRFEELYEHIREPYSFIVGMSLRGPIVQSIMSLPHLLISGSTGWGKSVFFRSMILSLLKSSKHLQLYLLDFKRGVEVKEFAALPNVVTAKKESDAVKILKLLVDEMNRRYDLMEKKGTKLINIEKDKLDLIVIGIDEAASLLGEGKDDEARQLVIDLARLGRAAGIHLVPSTQKPVKSAIDTETLSQLSGRMTFRMISSTDSTAATGGADANKLPAIKGRALWKASDKPVAVQAPFVDDKLVNAELEAIQEQFKNGEKSLFNTMLRPPRDTAVSKVEGSA